MKPITPVIPGGKAHEVVFAEDQPQYIPLPAHITADGIVVTRWRLSLGERLRVLLTGSIWLSVMTFGRPLQPVKLDGRCPINGGQR